MQKLAGHLSGFQGPVDVKAVKTQRVRTRIQQASYVLKVIWMVHCPPVGRKISTGLKILNPKTVKRVAQVGCNVFTLELCPRVLPGFEQRLNSECFNVESVWKGRRRNIGYVVGTAGLEQFDRAIYKIRIHQRAITSQTHHPLRVKLERRTTKTVQNIMKASPVTKNIV
jgi:hypothetical protein